MPSTRPPAPLLGAAWRACAVVAAAATLTWVVALFSPSHLPSRISYVSELFAAGQPWSTGLRVLDAVSGAALVVGAVLAALDLRGEDAGSDHRLERWAGRIAVAGFAVCGAATLVDAANPMSCAPSVSTECQALEAVEMVPTSHLVHTYSSSVAVAAGLVGVLAVTLLVWRARAALTRTGAWPAALPALWLLAAAAFVLSTGWVLAEIADSTIDSPVVGRAGFGALGWSQRVQITLTSACLVLLAATPTLRRVRPSRTAPAASPGGPPAPRPSGR